MAAQPLIQLHLPELYVGGIERWALTLMKSLSQFRWVVSIAADRVLHPLAQAQFEDLEIVNAEAGVGADLILATWGLTGEPKAPVVAVAHSAFPKYQELIQTLPYAHAVAVSRAARVCFPDGERVEIIPNGVDLARLREQRPRAAVRADLGFSPDGVVVGYVGRWGYQKNPLAAARAASQHPGAKVLYVGPPPTQPDWVEEAFGLADCQFVAPEAASAIGDLYRAMDVAVFASRSEGFGLAIAEACFCETPVVATEVGVVADHPSLATLVPQEADAETLGQALRTALDRPAPDRMAARALIEESYSAAVMARRWRDYLLERV